MTTGITSVSQLVTVIRNQLSAHAPAGKTPAGKTQAGAANKHAPGKQRGASPYAEENLGPLIELRVRQIGRDDPQRGRKAFRVFLEAVLLSHFGSGMVNDPAFHQMVDDIQLAMEGNVECARLIDSAIAQLLAEK
jgi:hypothetical protein